MAKIPWCGHHIYKEDNLEIVFSYLEGKLFIAWGYSLGLALYDSGEQILSFNP